MKRVGIIGGTGLYQLPGLEVVEKKEVKTPFGNPSAALTVGLLGKQEVVFLPRHGENHEKLPSEIQFRANIYALKSLGVTRTLSISAVGSLREDLKPGDWVIPSQYIDFTKGFRVPSFFGNGVTGHVSTALPVCHEFSDYVANSIQGFNSLHTNRTYLCVEGPRLGTQAESHLFRQWNADIVGMTACPEVFLAREAQMNYLTLAIVTDYDCWRPQTDDHVTVEKVIEQYKKSLSTVMKWLASFFENEIPSWEDSVARTSTAGALMTPLEAMSGDQRTWVQTLLL